ncbi:MAG: methyltransferase domain-containing protein [Pseudomonadales bacterium]
MSSELTAHHYDQATKAWRYFMGEDLHYGYFLRPDEPLPVATQNLTARMAEHGHMVGDDGPLEVLDVGCGVGAAAFYLAQRGGCRVTGISTSPVGVQIARERAAQLGLQQQVTFHCGDGMDNGLADRCVDRVLVLESSHLMMQKDRLIMECARVLRVGGRIALCDVMFRARLEPAQLVRHAYTFQLLRRVFGPAKLEPLFFYRQLAENNGLEVIVAEDTSRRMRPTFAHWKDNAQRHRSKAEQLIGTEGWAQFVEACDRLTTLWDQAILGYGLLVMRKGTH